MFRGYATSHPTRLPLLKPRHPTHPLRPNCVTRQRRPPKSPGPTARKAPAYRNPQLPDAPADYGRTISLHLSARTRTRHDFGMVLVNRYTHLHPYPATYRMALRIDRWRSEAWSRGFGKTGLMCSCWAYVSFMTRNPYLMNRRSGVHHNVRNAPWVPNSESVVA